MKKIALQYQVENQKKPGGCFYERLRRTIKPSLWASETDGA
jgi:hypothetical protein